MKILYVGTERAEAQAIATAVNSLSEGVKVSWTSGLDRVAKWIDETDGLRVLVVEAHTNGPVWRPVLTYAAGLPTALPVVVIVPDEIAPDLQALGLDAYECVARNPSLLRDLPAVITRAVDQARHRQLERAVRVDQDLKLVQATATIQEAEHRHQSAIAAAAEQLARSQAQYEIGMARAAATRDMVNEQFREAAIEVERVRLRHAAAVADAKRLARREAELSAQLDSANRTRGVLESRLADAETALHAGERKISEEIDKRRGVEDTLAQALGASTAAEQSHASAMSAAAAQSQELQEALSAARDASEAELMAAGKRAAERKADLEEQIRHERAARAELEENIADARAALAEARRENQSATADVARLIEREASLTSELAERQAHFDGERAEAEAKRGELTTQLREVEEARDQARREQQSAVADITRLTEREAVLDGRLKEERATRDALERDVALAAAALRDEQERHRVGLATADAELAERQAQFDRERAEAEAKRGELTTQLREVEEARDHARRDHESAVSDFTRVTEHAAAEREAAAACRTDLEARMSQANEKIEILQETLDRLTREHAAVLATRDNDIEQLRISHTAGLEQLEVKLQKSRADNHRLFQQGPLPMFRCTKDGALTQANRMLTFLLGRRSPDELRGADWAAAVFESPNDLSWLIERCLGSRGKESTETTWRRKDGSRLWVRLSACATSSDLIEASVEDLTPIRVLNDRLSQAHRMEAVGRLATEVAVTCGSLLGGVHQNAQQLLMTDDSNSVSRHRGEMLLDEISRAAGLLRQLAAYGDEESRKPATVELRTVVRDVAPVLKRVAGDAVEVELPAASAPLNVDAGAERVQRLLVNLAAYGRERMPLGGRLKIELGTTVVDRHFAAKHPNVRLGPHALVTVTESRRATRTDGSLQLHDDEAGSSSRSVAVQTGVDLGTLQELVAECGGHLWMTVEGGGDMVVKIRLPLVTSYGEPPRRTSARGGRVRTLGHWFQH